MPQNHFQRSFEMKPSQEGFLSFGGGNQLALNGNKRKSEEFQLPSTFGSTVPIMKKPKFSALPEFENNDCPMMDSFEVCGPYVSNHYSANNLQQTNNESHFVANGNDADPALHKKRDCYNYASYYGGMAADQRSTENGSQSVQNGNDNSFEVCGPCMQYNSYGGAAINTDYRSIEKEGNISDTAMHIAEPSAVNGCNQDGHATKNGYGKFDDYRKVYASSRCHLKLSSQRCRVQAEGRKAAVEAQNEPKGDNQREENHSNSESAPSTKRLTSSGPVHDQSLCSCCIKPVDL